MKLLIIGASGVLGSRLHNDAIKRKWNVLGTYYSHECAGLSCLDMRDKKSIDKVFDFFRPEVVVLCGGVTDVDLCESKPKFAEEINIKGTINVIKKTKECGSKMVLLSTDYIFNGESGPYSEDDKASPVNVYGRTKLEAENVARASLKECLIVRTAQLYGFDYRGKNFALNIIRNITDNKQVYAATDFYSTPTYAGSLSQSIIGLIDWDCQGVFNIAGRDFLDRYSYVTKIADIFKLKKSLIKKVLLKDLHLKARRPFKSGLMVDKAEKILKSSLMTVEKSLTLFKEEIG